MTRAQAVFLISEMESTKSDEGLSSVNNVDRHTKSQHVQSHTRRRGDSVASGDDKQRSRSRKRSRSYSSDSYSRSSRSSSSRGSERRSKSKHHKKKSRSKSRRRKEKRKKRKSKKESKKRSKKSRRKSAEDEDDSSSSSGSDDGPNVRRSVITGKKIKMHIEKDADDIARESARKDLLKFMNSSL